MTEVVDNDKRLEIKFVAYSTAEASLLNWLRMHPAGFVVPYPDRWVNNVYFDTYDYRAFAENLSGVSERTKVRYRWYGESLGPEPGALEIKRKRNRYGWKDRFKVETAAYEPGMTWRQVRRRIEGQVPPIGKLWLDQNPLSVMLNRYRRQYFCTADGTVRATVDTEQQAWDQRFHASPNFTRAAQLADTVVVEFKFPRHLRDQVTAIVQGIPVRMSRHSKYVNSVRAISLRRN